MIFRFIDKKVLHVVVIVSMMICATLNKVYVRAFSSARFSTFSSSQTRLWRSSSSSNIPNDLAVYSFSYRDSNRRNRYVLPRCYSLQQDNQSISEELEESRLGKKAARAKSKLVDKERNLKLKELLNSSNVDGSFEVPSLYAVKVSVCKELREELKMNGREKRGRVFIGVGSEGSQTLKGLKMELHSFFRSLRKSSFTLSAALPEVDEDGSILAPVDDEGYNAYPGTLQYWNIATDEDVLESFEKVKAFADMNPLMKRPSILIHVQKDPNAPAPPPPPQYLEGMDDPSVTESMTMLSFYAFPPPLRYKDYGIEDPEEFSIRLRKLWKPFGALGRVYVAREGVNAQMAIPTNVMSNFMECCNSIPELGKNMENGINIDPIPLSMEEFRVAGDSDNNEPTPPFKNLHIRVRKQVVADGLDKALDWEKAGYDMPPLEWHKNVQRLQNPSLDKKDLPILLDCRNDYETAVGKFIGAEPLNTVNFRESWDVLKERLADTPKDAPIMTYCTGGIRCVKVGAYLTQELGFTNVSRLAGGIIAYDRAINKEVDEKPLFEGINYVFDGRVGRKITDDKLGTCVTCGCKTNGLRNCKNTACHKRIVQCENCKSNFLGTCSDACKQRVVNGSMIPRKGFAGNWQSKKNNIQDVNDYSSIHSSIPPSLFDQIEENTKAFSPEGVHMVSGSQQGRLLTSLASMTRSGRILELGSYTGYATCCFVEGAANVAKATDYQGTGSREAGPFVLSLERDQRAVNLAAAHIDTLCRFGIEEDGANHAQSIRECDFEAYINEVWTMNGSEGQDRFSSIYNSSTGCELLKVDDALATVELIAAGKGLSVAPFDLVFVDADKTRLLDYVEACVSSDKLLKKGGFIIVDNVLWKGGVVEIAAGANVEDETNLSEAELKRSRRARKLAGVMHTFNDAIMKDDRVEVVLLPMRDGLSIIRKR